MVTVKLIIDKRTKKRDNTYPIKLRIIHQRKTHHIPLGISVLLKDWDDKNYRVKQTCKTLGSITRLNNLLLKKQNEAMKVLIKLEEENQLERMSFKDVKALILNKKDPSYVIEFCDEVIERLKKAGKVGNARVYKTLGNSIYLSLNGEVRDKNLPKSGKDIPFRQITYKWLENYEAWYFGRGNSANGLRVNMRTLRALFNKAIKQDIIKKEFYPFNIYKIKNEKTRKRAVSFGDIEKIKAFKPQTIRQKRAKDYFLISFYLMGASFIDIAFLKVSNIAGFRIEYKRRKTGQLHSIKITNPLQKILERYLDGKNKDDFILDVITSDEIQKQYDQIRDELRRYNKSLKEIAELCGIKAVLTSYVARHSFASIANNKNVPLTVISQALGHENPKTTEIYLSSFNNETMDEYNELIIGGE